MAMVGRGDGRGPELPAASSIRRMPVDATLPANSIRLLRGKTGFISGSRFALEVSWLARNYGLQRVAKLHPDQYEPGSSRPREIAG